MKLKLGLLLSLLSIIVCACGAPAPPTATAVSRTRAAATATQPSSPARTPAPATPTQPSSPAKSPTQPASPAKSPAPATPVPGTPTPDRRETLAFYRGLTLPYASSIWQRQGSQPALTLSLRALPDCTVQEQGPTEFPPVAPVRLELGGKEFQVFEWDAPRLARHVVWYSLRDTSGGQRRPEGIPILIASVKAAADWPLCRPPAEALIAGLVSQP